MDKDSARKLIQETFEKPFHKDRFVSFVKNLLNHVEDTPSTVYQGNIVADAYREHIQKLERPCKYTDPEGKQIDVLIVHLKKEASLERARTTQRNFIAKYLDGSRGGKLKDAALVAFVAPNPEDWRFSLVKMDYRLNNSGEKIKIEKDITPARRFSYLVGQNENSHTAQSRLIRHLEDDDHNPALSDLEDAFSIEKVTREFFEQYRDLFLKVKEALDGQVAKNPKIKKDFETKGIDTADFAKKLLGQIVFLYFLQKKGWFGVARDDDWGTGPKDFLRKLFKKEIGTYTNFFNDILEQLFYEALAIERTDDYYGKLNCRIPFLNGGLFDPINDYDWVHTDILLPNELFSNSVKTPKGDIGTGVLDVFDRYNFTVREDEPLEKEVAVDPEMLGKVFENLLEVKDRKSKGTYYTPREIVHYMCQESLVHYLDTAVNIGPQPLVPGKPSQPKLFGKPDPVQAGLEVPGRREIVKKEDLQKFIRLAEMVVEHDSRVVKKGRETDDYSYRLPESIRKNAQALDDALAHIRICDPAVGSGAFLVGMMSEIVRARTALTEATPAFQGKPNRTAYDFKRHAIHDCLYGVDIDPGAVEICKLRLWLSLVVDEEDIKRIKPLPNLDFKVVSGNSLLGVNKDLFNDKLFKELESLKPKFFDETGIKKKQKYKSQIDSLIDQITNGRRNFDFEVYFSEIFHEKEGFDIVLANPPYVRVDDIPRHLKEVFKISYSSSTGKYDLYYLFFEKALRLTNKTGIVVFISPNKFCAADSAKTLRDTLFKSIVSGKILSTSRLSVFDAASNYPVISIWERGEILTTSDSSFVVEQANSIDVLNRIEATKIYRTPVKVFERMPNKIIPINIGQTDFDLALRLYGHKLRLSNCLIINEGLRIPQSLETEFKQKFKIVKQFQFYRYSAIAISTFISEKNLKTVISYSSERFKNLLQKKLLIAEDGLRIEATLDLDKMVPQGGVYFAVPADSEFNISSLLGLLNSTLLSGLYKILYSGMHMGGGYLRYRSRFLENLPVPLAFQNERRIRNEIANSVDAILSTTKNDDWQGNPISLEKVNGHMEKIDRMVYGLYGLTPEEIQIIESHFKD